MKVICSLLYWASALVGLLAWTHSFSLNGLKYSATNLNIKKFNSDRVTGLNLNHNINKQIFTSSSSSCNQFLLKSTVGSTDLDSSTSKPPFSLRKLLDAATNLFPFWVLLFTLLGRTKPQSLVWFSPFITPALALTMLSMGMTLTIKDFYRVLQSPQYIAVGFLAQYVIMPFSALFLSKLLNLGPDISSGLILVGCAPGGTASNLVTLIAHADVPLSVMMTLVSTVAAVFMTPFLATRLANSYIKVQASDLVLSTLQVVLAPVIAGLTLNTFSPKVCAKVSQYMSFPCVMLVAMICGTVSASNSGVSLGFSSLKLLLAVTLLHASGFLWGFLFATLLRSGEQRARTISIETGMQNSALAVVLAHHFPNPQLSALPGSISATCHSVMGSILAAYWRNHKPKD